MYNQNTTGAVTSPRNVNDDRLATRYDGLDIVVTKRYSGAGRCWAGYTYSRTRVDMTSLANPNTAFVNAAGESGGRRHNFKASAQSTCLTKSWSAPTIRLQSGLPITRTWQVPVSECYVKAR